MTDQLKPCPFCGGKPEVYSDWELEHSIGERTYWIMCNNDGCHVQVFLDNEYSSKESAAKAWNTWHIPEGFALVPIEPTVKMLKASVKTYEVDSFGFKSAWPSDIYKVMIKAAGDQDD